MLAKLLQIWHSEVALKFCKRLKIQNDMGILTTNLVGSWLNEIWLLSYSLVNRGPDEWYIVQPTSLTSKQSGCQERGPEWYG